MSNKAKESIPLEVKDMREILFDFFHFYGTEYQMGCQVISTHIGQLESTGIFTEQQRLLPAQRR